MKLINFYEYERLSSLLKEMGAVLNQMKPKNSWEGIDDSKLVELLNTGEVEIPIEEIKTKGGIFEYKGRKVIVYIRDQYEKYHSRGYKFHLTRCNAIDNAFKNRRNSRYVISLRTDGQFKINLLNDNIVVKKDLVEPMKVCKYCLYKLDYKKYTAHPKKIKNTIYNDFNLEEYFSIYQYTKLNNKNFRNSTSAPLNIYNKDFKLKSKSIREDKNYTCQKCLVNLSKKENRRFLHTHHKDGDKSNDNLTNLQVLCIECHSNQPGHERLKYGLDYRNFMTKKENFEF